MVQDHTGFLWLGTQNGLVRYDGHDMVVHTPDPGKPGSFGGRTVEALWEDPGGDIWIGTFLSGLWRYDGRVGPLDPAERLSHGRKVDGSALPATGRYARVLVHGQDV